MRNYMTLSSPLPWRQLFAYIDTSDYLADKLFINEKVTIRFKKEYGKHDSRYIVVIASCRSIDWDKVESALKSLPDKMVIMGNTDYLDYSDSFINKLESQRETLGR